MARIYNIDSNRNYDIDGRTYNNTSSETRSKINSNRSYDIDGRNYSDSNSNSFSRLFSSRNSDVDARNYSNATHQTGGARIFSFKGGGTGKLATSLFSNVIMWLVIGLIAFLAFNFFWPLIKKWKANIDPTPDDAINNRENEILRHSSDRMSNGDTYMDASVWLFNEMFDLSSLVPWWKTTDHKAVGNYMLRVLSSEYTQLLNTYGEYKKKQIQYWNHVSSANSSLSTDLKDLFDESEQDKYLSHLNIF